MVKGVITHRVPGRNDTFEDITMLANVIAYAEKSSGGFEVFQLLQHPFGGAGNGAIIESKVNGFFVRSPAPKQLWIKNGQQ